MNIEVGDFLKLKDGRIVFVSLRNTTNSVSLRTAKKLQKEGKVLQKSENINGDEVF